MGGNTPGGNFLGGNFPGGVFLEPYKIKKWEIYLSPCDMFSLVIMSLHTFFQVKQKS